MKGETMKEYPNGETKWSVELAAKGKSHTHTLQTPVAVAELDKYVSATAVRTSEGPDAMLSDESLPVAVAIWDAHFEADGYAGSVPVSHKKAAVSALLNEGTVDVVDAENIDGAPTITVAHKIGDSTYGTTYRAPDASHWHRREAANSRRRISGGKVTRSGSIAENVSIARDLFVAAEGYQSNESDAIPIHHLAMHIAAVFSALSDEIEIVGN